jgi:hypothetical protein
MQLSPDALLRLPARDKTVAEECTRAFAWLSDDGKYAGCESSNLCPAKMSSDDIAMMLERAKIEPTSTRIRGGVKLFKHPEPAKKRWRSIQDCMDVNAGTELEQRTAFATILQRHAAVLNGKYVIDLDAAAYYDQFPLGELVREYFAFVHNKKKYRMRVLPMGLKHAVWIAQSATRQLLNFDMAVSVYVEPYIDNVRFVGDNLEELVEAAAMFCVRAARAGVTLNEVDVLPFAVPFAVGTPESSQAEEAQVSEALEAAKAALRPLVATKADWLGEGYDYEKKTVCMSDKTRAKLEATRQLSENATFKEVVSTFSILLYASRTYDMKLASVFAARKAHSAISRFLGRRPDLWDARAPDFIPSVKESIESWRQQLLQRPPRVVTAPQLPSAYIITDASDWGWGAFYITDSKQYYHSQAWTAEDRARGLNTKESTKAEPEGLLRALYRFVCPTVAQTIVMGTDATTAHYSMPKGHSSSFEVNAIVNRLNRQFPTLKLISQHVPGIRNPADRLSRGKEPTAEDWDLAMRMAAIALSTCG